jgi:hypothetical protein
VPYTHNRLDYFVGAAVIIEFRGVLVEELHALFGARRPAPCSGSVASARVLLARLLFPRPLKW